ncbi:MAG: helicase-exonuclease AddAB subunit AddA, partial [Mogibacterium sp.]|nr:helicase-exonuclease AddAB subunit AddA [Mogibacterium sp.]
MAGFSFSDEQRLAIDTLDRSILVAAAAGSGKTAVLIERIINIILQGQADVDEMLVVTFTNAAASEMKLKLQKALRDRMETDPGAAERLSAQLDRMYQSYISTFHSFALRVIREFFYKIDMEPGFGICDEVQAAILQNEAMEELFEQCFEQDDYLPGGSFRDFLRHYSSDRGEEGIISGLLSNYDKLRSIPRYFEWAERRAELLRYPEDGIETSPVCALLRQAITANLRSAEGKAEEAMEILLGEELPKAAGVIADDLDKIHTLQSMFEAADHPESGDTVQLEELFREAGAMKFGTLRVSKGEKDAYEAVKEDIQKLRDTYKKLVRDLLKQYAEPGLEERFREMDETYGYTRYYLEILKAFEKRFSEKKREQNLMEFADIEHTCAAILEDPEAAAVLKNRFRYIFIDEYQDTNKLQEYLISLIARPDNLFKVGDIKQSIYRFRQSDPKIFEQVREEYSQDDRTDALTIDLNRNYRSNGRTIAYINTIFEAVMPGYDENARLYQGLPGDPEYDLIPETHVLLEQSDEEDSASGESGEEDEEVLLTKAEAEAVHIAGIVRGIIGTEFYDGKQNLRRRATPGDIVIRMRGPKGSAHLYYKALLDQGIPAHVKDDEGYFDTVEISIAMSLLSIIDNYRQDVPLISVMRSEIGGFTEEELAEIRACANDAGEKIPYHAACARYLENGADPDLKEKLGRLNGKLEQWRMDAGMMPLDEFVWHVLTNSGYYLCAGAMYGGRQRQANLRALAERAAVYQSAGTASLSGFLRYIRILRKKEVRTGQAILVSEEDDVVRIMTIHKSKGLEFPFVIVAGMGRRLRYETIHKGFLIDSDLGVSISYVNKEKRFWRSTILQQLIVEKSREEDYQEELRILYVALTRAREKLILVGTMKDQESVRRRYTGRSSYYDIIRRQLMTTHNVFQIGEARAFPPRHRVNPLDQFLQRRDSLDPALAEAAAEQVRQRLDYRYPHEEALR